MDPEVNRRSQAELYGEPLAEVVGGICEALAINQATVARVLGLSSPMLSHLVAARRVKVSNPLAHSRLVRLRQLATDVEAGGIPRSVAKDELDQIATSQDSWATSRTQSPELEARLRGAAGPDEWAIIVKKLSAEHPRVASVLGVFSEG